MSVVNIQRAFIIIHMYTTCLLLLTVVSSGCSLSESVMAIVVGKSGSCSDGAARRSNLFDSETHSLKDDGREPFGPRDFK